MEETAVVEEKKDETLLLFLSVAAAEEVKQLNVAVRDFGGTNLPLRRRW